MKDLQGRLLRRQPRHRLHQSHARQGAGAARSRELEMTEIPFKDLPLYSYDYDADYPPVARAFKQAIAPTPSCSSPRNTTARSPAG